MSFKWSIPSFMVAGRPTESEETAVSYTAEIEIGGVGSGVFSDITGWTPDSPFNFPMVAGEPLQTRNASDESPIIIIASYNNSAKGAAVILIKNGVIQQTKNVTGASPPQTFDPLVIEDGDTVKVQGN